MNAFLTYVFAVVGVIVPVAAFLWEFVLAGRKRLGYRVQVNDPVRAHGDTAEEEEQLGVLQQLVPEAAAKGETLKDMSVVLLKIENNGWTDITEDEYLPAQGKHPGITFRFPGRTVKGVALTAPSPAMKAVLRDHTAGVQTDEDGRDGLITLPRFALAVRDSYKIMAVLQRSPGAPAPDDDQLGSPDLEGRIKGGKIRRTESRTRPSLAYGALVALLVLAVVVQFIVGVTDKSNGVPMDCAGGQLSLVGSSAVAMALHDNADNYQHRCPSAHIDATNFKGSDVGLHTLVGGPQTDPAGELAFTDGRDTEHPQLIARPMAFVIFALVVNPGVTGIQSLSLQQVKDLYAGKYTNWNMLKPGLDLPVRLVGRHRSSGSRQAFEREVLGADQPPDNSVDCAPAASPQPALPARCEADTTTDLLNLVAATPGAIGYSEVSTASANPSVRVLEIDEHQATRANAISGRYRFGAPEYAYSVGPLPPDSLAASFLRYLGFGEGKDILSKYGEAPCGELANPVDCRPYN